uniref:THAP domain-containing protein 1 n=1 Tax=Nothobranchius furzeri TaxID=105023 RepID=A0A8C6Q1G5_NOTFU
MPHCAAFGCNFQSEDNKGSDVSLHSFPTGKKLRKQWEDACGWTQLPKDPRLCSQHFSPDAIERRKLNALPTIFPHKEPKGPRRDKRRWTLSRQPAPAAAVSVMLGEPSEQLEGFLHQFNITDTNIYLLRTTKFCNLLGSF